MFKRFLLSFLVLGSLAGCRQEVMQGLLPEGKIALTFDDFSIDNWYQSLPLLDSLGIKATFYVCRYHELSRDQKIKLHAIENAGHEIAYHTTYHTDLRKTLEKKGMAYLLSEEIRKDKELMLADGFTISNFAYPYGSHSVELDNQLLRYFHSLRALCNKNNYEKSLALQSCRNQVFYAPDIDDNKRNVIENDIIEKLIRLATEKNSCAVFAAHQINNPAARLNLSVERLKMIADLARQYHVQFITVRNISN